MHLLPSLMGSQMRHSQICTWTPGQMSQVLWDTRKDSLAQTVRLAS